MSRLPTRRQFIQRSGMIGAGLWLAGCQTAPRRSSANERLNVGIIGTANRAASNIAGVQGQNIVALCDVDASYLAAAAQKFPAAKTYTDFRRLLDRRDLDAVVVSTPDHTHAVITVMALKSGHHVYCEKPLAHTVSEARIVAETAKRNRRVTQMGNQIHAGGNYRRVVELIQSNAIGPVREVHVWVDVIYGGADKPPAGSVPKTLDYNLWLGPVPERPFSPEYHPVKWRNWWAFGGGTMSDFCCHHMDLPHWALDLRHPVTVETEGPEVHPEAVPVWMIVRYEYPARGAKPPVRLTWYQGGKRPVQFERGVLPKWGNGTLFVGEKGMLLADYTKHVMLPDKDFAGFVPPPRSIPDSIGHYNEWIGACKTGGLTTCNFDYGGALTEAGLLGNVAFRTGRKLEWDPAKLRAVNAPEADRYLLHHYRKGWKI